MLTITQFFSDGFGERKLQFLIDFATAIISKHNVLGQNPPTPRQYSVSQLVNEKKSPVTLPSQQKSATPREFGEISPISAPVETTPQTRTGVKIYSLPKPSPREESKMPSVPEAKEQSPLAIVSALLLSLKKVLVTG